MLRILLWLFEVGILVTLAAAALASVFAFNRSFTAILRSAATLAIAAGISTLLGIGVGIAGAIGGTGDPVSGALLAMILSLPVTVWALDRSARRRARVGVARGETTVRALSSIEPAGDLAVAKAWRHASRLAPMQRLRIAPARDACAYVLAWSQQYPFDMEAMECAVLIRKRLPDLVEQTARYCTLADRAERRTVVDAMVSDLESLGRMALRRVEQSKALLGESLAATRAHIASRTTETHALEG